MSLLRNSVVLLYVILFILSACSFTFAAPIETTKVTSVSKDSRCYHYIMTALLLLADKGDMDEEQKRTRVKRSGYAEATKMGPMKLMQFAVTFFRNLIADEPVGGRHPMSRTIPRPVVLLFKKALFDTLFPTDLNVSV